VITIPPTSTVLNKCANGDQSGNEVTPKLQRGVEDAFSVLKKE